MKSARGRHERAMQNLLEQHRIEADEQDVFRMMGYPRGARVPEPVLQVCREQISRLTKLADPWGGYREIGIQAITDDGVQLTSGGKMRSRRIAGILRHAKAVKVCLVTLGSPAAMEIRQLVADDCAMEALALDAAASAATNTLMGRIHERVCSEASERNCGTTVQYGPGYTGWDIIDLHVLFECLGGGELPVRLNEQLMMVPEKSLLGVIGIVPGSRSRSRVVVPCRACDLEGCSVRTAPFGRRYT